jgi:hypothetical protein
MSVGSLLAFVHSLTGGVTDPPRYPARPGRLGPFTRVSDASEAIVGARSVDAEPLALLLGIALVLWILRKYCGWSHWTPRAMIRRMRPRIQNMLARRA